jgi:hypothetical protein
VLATKGPIALVLRLPVNLAAVVPGTLDQISLAFVFFSSFAKWVLQPCIKPAGMNAQASTLRTDRKKTVDALG